MRVYDVNGTAAALIRERLPDAQVDGGLAATAKRSGSVAPYDAAVIGDLADADSPEARIRYAAMCVKAGGRVIVSAPQNGGARVLRPLDVADMLRRHGTLDEFGVTDDGRIVASLVPCRRRGEVAVWTGYAIGPWHPSDIEQRGLGGSETAAYRLSEELAKMGYLVTLYGQFESEGMVGDVMLRQFQHYDPTGRLHAFVGFRDARRFDHRPNADTTILWLEDLAPAEGLSRERAANIDRIVAVSHFHKRQTLEAHPWLEERHVVASRNAITHEFFEGEQPERERRVVYTSSPDRGLQILLEVWPQVRERVPDAVLLSTYSRWYDICAATFDQGKPAHEALLRQLDATEGAKRVEGGMGQRALAQLLRSSLVWAHPSFFAGGDTEFHETNCIASQEAQAAGCVVVASNWGALSEFVMHGTLIDGDPRDLEGEWRRRFVDAIVQGLTDEDVQRTAQKLGPEMMRNMDWRGAAEQLAGLFGVGSNGSTPAHGGFYGRHAGHPELDPGVPAVPAWFARGDGAVAACAHPDLGYCGRASCCEQAAAAVRDVPDHHPV